MDWVLVTAALLLVGVGMLSIYSSSLGREDFLNFKKQIIFAGLGLILMMVLSFVDYRIIRNDPHLILIFYFLCLVALLGLFFFAPQIRGVKSWYKIGPMSFDPVEMTKLILLILLAQYFSIKHTEAYQIKHIILSGVYVAIPAVLVFFQPNLGSVLILVLLWLSILAISGVRLRHFLLLCLIGILMFTLSWNFLFKEYQKARFLSFVFQKAEPLEAGWSQMQSRIAIGSGGIWGKGIGAGSQTQYGFLPEPQTDFVFAALSEELGMVGAIILFSLFLILIWRIVKIGLAAETNFTRLFTAGFAILLVSQMIINIGMNLGLLPIVGIPLPLVSYGGSSLVMIFLSIGILQNIRINL